MLGLLGILLGLALIMVLAFRSWTILLLAPLAAAVAALFSGQPMLAHWTQTFMPGAARFVAQWFPIFLLGGLFGKLMDDSGSIAPIAKYLTERLGTKRTILSVVLASAIVTYGGVSVFVAFFVQFVDPGYAYPALSFVVLGAFAQIASVLYRGALVFGGARLAAAFRRRKRLSATATAAAGALFLGFAVKLSLAS